MDDKDAALRLLDAIERGPCPTCGEYPARHPDSPRWDQDKTARMLGLPIDGHCADCGRALGVESEDG